jgi:ABC-type oligopeptide transport system ATPase subunit
MGAARAWPWRTLAQTDDHDLQDGLEDLVVSDVSIQAQVPNLLAGIRDETAVSYVLISHDLAVVRQLTDEAIVLHRGEVVERGRTAQILDDAQHSYTRRLRASVPRPGWKPAGLTMPYQRRAFSDPPFSVIS